MDIIEYVKSTIKREVDSAFSSIKNIDSIDYEDWVIDILYTNWDAEEFEIEIPVPKDGIDWKDGKDGVDWKDYVLTEEDKKQIAWEIAVPIVEKIIEKTEIIKEQPIITNEIKEVAKYETPKQIVTKLESLEWKDRLDAKAIKWLESFMNEWPRAWATRLTSLTDTNIINPANGQILSYNKWRDQRENVDNTWGGWWWMDEWLLTWNAGTNPATDFIGTTDAQPLVVRTNNIERARVLADGKVAIGGSAPQRILHTMRSDGTVYTAWIANTAEAWIDNTTTTNGNFSSLAFATRDSIGAYTYSSRIAGIHQSHTSWSVTWEIAFTCVKSWTQTEIARMTAEAVGIWVGVIERCAILELRSDTKWFLPPRMNVDARTSISSPVEWLIVYDTDDHKLYVYTNAGWEQIQSF